MRIERMRWFAKSKDNGEWSFGFKGKFVGEADSAKTHWLSVEELINGGRATAKPGDEEEHFFSLLECYVDCVTAQYKGATTDREANISSFARNATLCGWEPGEAILYYEGNGANIRKEARKLFKECGIEPGDTQLSTQVPERHHLKAKGPVSSRKKLLNKLNARKRAIGGIKKKDENK